MDPMQVAMLQQMVAQALKGGSPSDPSVMARMEQGAIGQNPLIHPPYSPQPSPGMLGTPPPTMTS